jgi:hypothetical protein
MRTTCAWLGATILLGCSSGAGGADGGDLDGATAMDGSKPDGATSMDAGADTQSGGDAASDAPSNVPAGTIQGIVTRTPQLTFSGDGKGKLWIDIGTSCPYQGNIQVTKTVTVPNVDLNPTSAMIPFTMTGVAPGMYYVWGWLDDNGDDQPFPMGGDPGNYPMCTQVTLTANAGASTTLVFNGSTWN